MQDEYPAEEPGPEGGFPPEASKNKPPKRAKVHKLRGNGADTETEGEARPAAFSDDALATEWIAKHGEDWRYVRQWDTWFEWVGHTWLRNQTAKYFDLARHITREALLWPGIGELTAAQRRKVNSASTAAAMLSHIKSDAQIRATIEQWDADPFMLATPEGVIDLKLGKLIEASREQYCTRCTSVAPAEGVPEVWNQCLARWFGNDDTLIRYFQLFAGYCATGDTREKMFLFVHGPADSGKSTAVEVLMAVLGTYAQSASMDTFTETKHERHSTELAELAGARFVAAPETEEGKQWNQSRINALTGKDRIRARFMRQDNFEYTPQFKLMVYGNHAPMLKQVDDAMRRRLHILPFPHSIPREEQDSALDTKLRAEYPQILAWIIQGAAQWLDYGLTMPEAVSAATAGYLDGQDSFGDWVSERLIVDPVARCTSAEAYKSYKDHCEAEGVSVLGSKRFVAQMEMRGFRRIKSDGQRLFQGCRLRGLSDI